MLTKKILQDTIKGRRNINLATTKQVDLSFLYSTFNRLVCLIALCLRLIHNTSHQSNKITELFQPGELDNATYYIVRAIHLEFW